MVNLGRRPHKITNTGNFFMHSVRGIVEELKVFERNKVPPPFELRS